MSRIEKDIGAIILAGGKSSRFGTDKALFPIHGVPLIQNVIDVVERVTSNIIIITNSIEKLKFLNYPLYEDIIPNAGPLGGIYTGLTHSSFELNLVLPCDMPHITPACLNYLIHSANGNDITVPYHNNMLEPLCAVYSKTCVDIIKKHLQSKNYQIFQFYKKVKTQKVHFHSDLPFYHQRLFSNINSKQDLQLLSYQN